MTGINYFGEDEAAARYARYRPYVHDLIAARIGAVTGRVAAALDVGCGTGQSARALLDWADRVMGADISAAMLAHVPHTPGLSVVETPAETLPFADASFDLVASGLAFHWFDQPAFLAEAHRVLRAGGWLALYNHGFTGVMIDDPAYEAWHRNVYYDRFPDPPRNLQTGGEGQWAEAGFAAVHQDIFTNDILLSLDDWAGYLTTQSNVIARLEDGGAHLDEVGAWLKSEGAPFFKGAPRLFRFACRLDLYRAD
jgi:SAM-dependent methyltransferase